MYNLSTIKKYTSFVLKPLYLGGSHDRSRSNFATIINTKKQPTNVGCFFVCGICSTNTLIVNKYDRRIEVTS